MARKLCGEIRLRAAHKLINTICPTVDRVRADKYTVVRHADAMATTNTEKYAGIDNVQTTATKATANWSHESL